MIPLKLTRIRTHPLIFGILLALVCLVAGTRAKAQGDDIFNAAENGDSARVKALLKGNPDLVLRKNRDGKTPLLVATAKYFYASRAQHRDVAALLLANGADVNAKDSDGWTPLHSAAILDDKDMVGLLLANRADVNAKEHNGQTPLHYANRAMAALLLANGADANAKDKEGKSLLHHAASQGRKDLVDLLLANKADVNAKDSDGWTPLHYAQTEAVAELLLIKGADANAKDHEGKTPLHLAVSRDEKDIVELLLGNKADVSAKDDAGKTPLDLAVTNDVAELLRQQGGLGTPPPPPNRNSTSRFVWPKWLPEYPGWYEGKYFSRPATHELLRGGNIVAYLDIYGRDADQQGEEDGSFGFTAPLVPGPKIITPDAWLQFYSETRAAVVSFYQRECKALGMTVELELDGPWTDNRTQRPFGLVATDAQHQLLVETAAAVGRPGSGGVKVSVSYFGCTTAPCYSSMFHKR